MYETGVNHAIRAGSSAAQTVQVFEITSMHLRPGGDKSLGARLRTSKADHLMARIDEFLHDGRADEACSASNKDTHR